MTTTRSPEQLHQISTQVLELLTASGLTYIEGLVTLCGALGSLALHQPDPVGYLDLAQETLARNAQLTQLTEAELKAVAAAAAGPSQALAPKDKLH